MKLFKIIAIALVLIIAIILIKFRQAYSVSLNGEEIGYVGDEEEFQNEINENILTPDESNVAFVELDEVEYTFTLVNRNFVDESTVLATLEESSQNVYRVYEVADLNNEETKVYVNSMEEAEEMVSTLK